MREKKGFINKNLKYNSDNVKIEVLPMEKATTCIKICVSVSGYWHQIMLHSVSSSYIGLP